MDKQERMIGHIPALLWGRPAGRLLLAVHGDQSHKADTVIAMAAEAAEKAGCQVLSFDLPEHGARAGGDTLCKVQTCVAELRTVLEYARGLSERLSLFACSLGAHFSLAAYGDAALEQCLFLSPVVDMERLIGNMMQWAGVDEARLRREGEIATPFGKTLYWDYYRYVKEHPIRTWNAPTAILYGEKDTVSEYGPVSAFARRFGCGLTVMEGGGHFFHTEPQLAFYRGWLEENLCREE